DYGDIHLHESIPPSFIAHSQTFSKATAYSSTTLSALSCRGAIDSNLGATVSVTSRRNCRQSTMRRYHSSVNGQPKAVRSYCSLMSRPERNAPKPSEQSSPKTPV